MQMAMKYSNNQINFQIILSNDSISSNRLSYHSLNIKYLVWKLSVVLLCRFGLSLHVNWRWDLKIITILSFRCSVGFHPYHNSFSY